MIYHVSFGVDDPGHVAKVLAELTQATPLLAPSPPFPFGSWLVCYGDSHGALLELIPSSFVFDREAPLGVKRDGASAGPGAAHVLASSPLTHDGIQAIARREGWPAQEVETGLFKFVKVWVEDKFPVELLTPEEARRYAGAFGAQGLATLDGRLRGLETAVAAVLAEKMPAETLAAALGMPPAA